MHLYELPIFFALNGVVLYAVLAGADFGAGMWQLAAGRGARGRRVRDLAHHSMAPVWEANHVWLIFVLVVVWTAYPVAFASLASTLSVALFLAGLGIILRGSAYALRSAARTDGEIRVVDTVTGVGSLLAPFALAAAAGGIASERVPVGNAAGNLVTSWLNPTSAVAGVLALVMSAYLAAVYLAADARRDDEQELAESFRLRALLSGSVAGVVAIAGAVVAAGDSPRIFDHLFAFPAVISVAISLVAGVGTLALVTVWRLEAARITAAVAVAALVGGWALAQNPVFLHGLTVRQAAAPTSVIVPLTVAIVAGGLILFPSLAVLFRLALGGTFSADPVPGRGLRPRRAKVSHVAATAGIAGAALATGSIVLVLVDAGWAQVSGVVAMVVFMLLGFRALSPGADERD